MAILRTVALAAPVAALMLAALPAHACDSNYPWLCKPVPSIDSSETADTSKAAKPLPITSQRKEARAAKPATAGKAAAKSAKARVQRSAQTTRRHVARKPPARRLVLRARHPNLAAASMPEDSVVTPSESTRITSTKASDGARKPAAASVGNAEPADEPVTGFAAAWERSTGLAEPVGAAPVGDAPAAEASEPDGEPAPATPVPVASQSEVNEIDLAAPEPAAQSDGSWLRGLFIAFGGILALGSALRLFL